MKIHTVGHSTRGIDDFIGLLKEFGIKRIVDIRTIPRSRYNPQFNRDTLPASLAAAGIEYTHAAGLGGLRHARADSPNRGWRNPSFRGYADYMQTDDFQHNLGDVVTLAEAESICLMCAEAVPWRCHRWLVADALTVRGVAVEHILGPGQVRPHALTAWARVTEGWLTYPAVPEV